MDSVTQLPLNIYLRPDANFNNFYDGNNRVIINYLKNFLHNSQDWFVYLWGNSGSGRTHLLQAIYYLAEACGHQVVYLPLREVIQTSPDLLENLENFSLVLLDDIDIIKTNALWQEAIFHLYNRIHAAKHHLLVSASCAPQNLNFTLSDLSSRLIAGTVFRLKDLSEEQKLAALQIRAKQYGLTLSLEVAEFMLHHWQRDLPSLLEALEKLDHASLVAKRKLTIPFVKSVLNI